MLKRLCPLLLVLALASCSPAPAPRLAEGHAFPAFMLDFVAKGLAGARLPAGQFLIVNVWASWCGPCRREMPSLQRLSQRLAGRFTVLGVSTDDDARLAAEFLGAAGVGFANVLDQGGKAAQQLGLTMYPETFVIAPDGTLLLRMTGAREWDSPEMLARLAALDGAAGNKVYHVN